eukprot:CAMPEP_0181525412 /NCGR_PEP_ID=MMETSP1110-20121109/68955_1 /TAXON_ID=174948 /ORGANISM="Symbiodinium sp., Strain CCMP421" /LENGTH=124 /DNA_ID=CAMNT_0023656217 /DNA_START=931 /DNA_END=1305 /DNA_ORIENTATION=+
MAPRQRVKQLLVTLRRDMKNLAGAADKLVGIADLVEHPVLPRGRLDPATHEKPANCQVIELWYARDGIALPEEVVGQLHHSQARLHVDNPFLGVNLDNVLQLAGVDRPLARRHDSRADAFPVRA